MTLWIELGTDDLRRLRRTSSQRPSGGYADLAAAIVANTRERRDGSGWSELSSRKHIRQFCRQRETGDGGYQHHLRQLAVTLELNGRAVTSWPDIVRTVAQADAPYRGRQLVLF